LGWGVLDLGYWHVDVFSRRALQGNGLVVVLDAENLSTAVMQELTREVRQFETAFLAGVDLPSRSARLRIFTEDEELDFAGHPVLGAAAVLHTLLPVPAAEESWALAVARRRVETRTRGAAGWVDAAMDQGVPQFGPALAGELADAYRSAGQFEDAILIGRRALASRERIQGAQHADTTRTRQHLADAYLALAALVGDGLAWPRRLTSRAGLP